MFVDRGRRNADDLIVRYIPPPIAFTFEHLRVKAPPYDRVNNQVIVAVLIKVLRKREKVALSAIVPSCTSRT